MKNNRRIRQITGIALLSALAIALQFLSNFIASIGIASITLALIPIVVAACVYGPYAGLLVGVLVGASVLPGAVFFLNFSPVVTVFVCLLKTGLAGLLAGFIFKWLCKKNSLLAVIIASISVPLINTGLYLIAVYVFYIPAFEAVLEEGTSVYTSVLVATLSVNFLLEFLLNSCLSPVIHRLILLLNKKYDIGMINYNKKDNEVVDNNINDNKSID